MRRPALPVLLLALALLSLGGCLTGADTDLKLRDAEGDANNAPNNAANNSAQNNTNNASNNNTSANNTTGSNNNTTGSNNTTGTNNPMCAEAVELFVDGDGDGFGADGATRLGCPGEVGTSEFGGDCDDRVAAVNPGAAEVCDGADNDCNGGIDDAPSDGLVLFRDLDRDGAGDSDQETTGCEVSAGLALAGGDCDDLNPGVGPQREEVCGDGVDNDCDGNTDEAGCAMTAPASCAAPLQLSALGGRLSGSLAGAPLVELACFGVQLPATYVEVDVPTNMTGVLVAGLGGDSSGIGVLSGSCAAPEVYGCGLLRSEVDYMELAPGPHTLVVFGEDRWELTLSYVNVQTLQCTLPDVDGDGSTMCELDCAEGDATRYPGAREQCDGLDNDCSGEVDDLRAPCTTAQAGICAAGTLGCIHEDEVCAPARAAGEEVCGDGQDNDCDGSTDEPSCAALPPAETCANAVLLEDGVPVEGVLSEARADLEVGCAGQGVHDLIYILDVESGTASVKLNFEMTAPLMLTVLRDRCTEDAPNEGCYGVSSQTSLYLAEGRYFLVVSGDGAFRMTMAQEDEDARCSVPDSDDDGATICQGDCDDTRGDIGRGAVEACDGVDNNCNGQIDEVRGTCTLQALGVCAQGVLRCGEAGAYCEAQLSAGDEVCGDGLDNDCDGGADEAACLVLAQGEQCSNARVLVDGERVSGTLAGSSGDASHACLGGDSFADQFFRIDIEEDQDQVVVFAGTSSEQTLLELYEGVCGGEAGCYSLGSTLNLSLAPGSHYFSLVGSADYTIQVAHQGPPSWECSVGDLDGDGWTLCDGDCDEGDSSVYPDAPELCDGRDNDCDGRVDELSGSCTTDQPGVCRSGTQRCVGGQVACVPIVEAGVEACGDGRDNNCNGRTDESGCMTLLPGEQCSNAINLGAGGSFSGELSAYALERPAACAIGVADPGDAYYYLQLTGPMTRALHLVGGASASPTAVVSVYAGGCDGELIVSCAPLTGSQVLYLEPGDYFFRVEGAGPWEAAVALEQLSNGMCSIPDGDGDGVTICGGDCADDATEVRPGGEESCNGLDDDCNGAVDDVRGECAAQAPGRCARGLRRCDDLSEVCDVVVQPISELCGDGIDNDCDGSTDETLGCTTRREGDTCARAVPIDASGSYAFNLTTMNRNTFVGQCGDFPGSDQLYQLQVDEPRVLNVYIPPEAGTIFAHVFRGDCELQDTRDCWTASTNTRQLYLEAGVWYLALSGTGSGELQLSW